jgi:hypothetical protein
VNELKELAKELVNKNTELPVLERKNNGSPF